MTNAMVTEMMLAGLNMNLGGIESTLVLVWVIAVVVAIVGAWASSMVETRDWDLVEADLEDEVCDWGILLLTALNDDTGLLCDSSAFRKSMLTTTDDEVLDFDAMRRRAQELEGCAMWQQCCEVVSDEEVAAEKLSNEWSKDFGWGRATPWYVDTTVALMAGVRAETKALALIERLNLDGRYQDKNGRWHDANNCFCREPECQIALC